MPIFDTLTGRSTADTWDKHSDAFCDFGQRTCASLLFVVTPDSIVVMKYIQHQQQKYLSVYAQ